jgi:hypothetical protein
VIDNPQGSAIEFLADRMKNWMPAFDVTCAKPLVASAALEKEASKVNGAELMHEEFISTWDSDMT